MNVIYSVKDYVTNVFDFNQATASGAIDIVAVQHEDGTYRCTPFHVHFGKSELKNKAEKLVALRVNGKLIEGVHMKLGAAGEAFFVDSVETPVTDDYSTSPLASPSSGVTLPTTLSTAKQPASTATAETPSGQSTEQSEWHDAYRLVSDPRPTLRRETSAPAERLTWGWGALPIVQAASVGDLSAITDESNIDEEMPAMVKSDSVYFDAVDTENLPPIPYTSDHPCMSLCGHLLEDAQTREAAHGIFSEHIITFEAFKDSAAEFLQNPDLRFLIDGKICPFNTEIQAYLVSRVLFPSSQPLPLSSGWKPSTRHQRRSERLESSFWFGDLDEEDEEDEEPEEETRDEEPSKGRRWFQWFPRSSSSGDDVTQVPSFQPVQPAGASQSPVANAQTSFFRKTLEPSQEQLKKLELRYGTNEIEFVVQGTNGEDRVSAKLYLWPVSAKIIIAEIDGAISRAPSGRRLSTLLPIMEREAAGPHHGALEFYARAARNGYRIVYLTSRGLSQADLIHAMLRGSSGNSNQLLPNGPVLLSPDRLLEANPDDTTMTRDFKFAALNGIRTLFPQDLNPFYAAFGKTYADSVVFTQVGVFPGKVFLVDEGDGRLRHRSMMNFKESYFSLLELVDKMFPPICSPSPRHTFRRSSRSSAGEDPMALLAGLPPLSPSSSFSPPFSPTSKSIPTTPQTGMRRVLSATEELVSEVISSQVRTRSMGDEAYNDVNFWRIKPGSI